jgi:hypothetical protein
MSAPISKLLAVAVLCSSIAAGCGSKDDGSEQEGDCPTSISGAQGANNGFAKFNGVLSGDYSGPDGSARYSSICLRLADVPQTLAITVMGTKPAFGVSYNVSNGEGNPTGDVAVIEYAEGNNGTKVWVGNAGSVKIESVARQSVGLTFAQVTMEPEAGKPNDTASGTFVLSGSQRADDVLGFVP